jgi:very-short-patch-repair endonuclease
MFTMRKALAAGLTEATVKWGARTGRWRQIIHGVYGCGDQEPSDLDRAVARVFRASGIASGRLAAVLHGLDDIRLDDRPLRRRQLPAERIVVVSGVRCADGLQTLLDLAGDLSDDAWEVALESALRKRLTSIKEIEAALAALSRSRTPGTARIRRVLALRPPGMPPTGSYLETKTLQLARRVEGLPAPLRQARIDDKYGQFVAHVDLSWPSLGLFLELDGEQHAHQPVHDANRETAVVAATGWLCGRFTWTEVIHNPAFTTRRLASIVDQARRRPVAPSPPRDFSPITFRTSNRR